LYTRPAARGGLVAIVFTHADAMAAPFGGTRAFFGTNPIAIAFPRAGHEPACLDMATTSIPFNRVINARREGHLLPPDVACDAAGNPTTDADAARALIPLGGAGYGHKGYGLALMIDLLCGPLNANPWGSTISNMFTALDEPRRLGAFFLMLDPLRFAGGETLAATVEAIARALSSEPGAPLMPGDPELCEEALRCGGHPRGTRPGCADARLDPAARRGRIANGAGGLIVSSATVSSGLVSDGAIRAARRRQRSHRSFGNGINSGFPGFRDTRSIHVPVDNH
jgi:hypothetical protein